MRRAALVAALVVLTASLWPQGEARASGIGAPSVGTGWSGVTTADPAAAYWNPSLLADLKGFRLQMSGGIIYSYARYHRERRAQYQHEDGFDFAVPLAEADLDPSKTGWAEPVDAHGINPSGALFASYQVIDDLTIGLGAYPGFAAVLKMPDVGPHMWQLQEAFIVGLYVTPAVGWRIADWVQVGAGVSLVVGGLALRQVSDMATTPLLADAFADDPINQENDFGSDAPAAVRELRVLSRPVTINQATAIGWSFNAGVTFTPLDSLRIGLVYQHGADLVFEGDAYLDMDHDFFTGDLAYDGLEYPKQVKGRAFVELPMPMAIRLGVSYSPIDALNLHLQASWLRWSIVESLRVTLESDDLIQEELGIGPVAQLDLARNWNDAVEIELLTTYDLNADMRLGLRLGYHSPASPDTTVDLASIDGHRLVAGVMGRYVATENVALDLWVQLHQVLPRRVVASEYDRGNGEYLLTILGAGGALDLTF